MWLWLRLILVFVLIVLIFWNMFVPFRTKLFPRPALYSSMNHDITYLTQTQAQNLDQDLVTQQGFSFEVLMELAGLSVAQAVASAYPKAQHPRVLIVAGPGNNGGDGLVCARHMKHFGYDVTVVYPKQVDKPIYNNLVTQVKKLRIPLQDALPPLSQYNLVVDAIFGFSFSGAIRAPFDKILQEMRSSTVPIASIDIPSGWDVEKGNESGEGLDPEFLSDDAKNIWRLLVCVARWLLVVSLTAPKLMAKNFKGKFHFLGGRFVPPEIAEKFNLILPQYPGFQQFVELPKNE